MAAEASRLSPNDPCARRPPQSRKHLAGSAARSSRCRARTPRVRSSSSGVGVGSWKTDAPSSRHTSSILGRTEVIRFAGGRDKASFRVAIAASSTPERSRTVARAARAIALKPNERCSPGRGSASYRPMRLPVPQPSRVRHPRYPRGLIRRSSAAMQPTGQARRRSLGHRWRAHVLGRRDGSDGAARRHRRRAGTEGGHLPRPA